MRRCAVRDQFLATVDSEVGDSPARDIIESTWDGGKLTGRYQASQTDDRRLIPGVFIWTATTVRVGSALQGM